MISGRASRVLRLASAGGRRQNERTARSTTLSPIRRPADHVLARKRHATFVRTERPPRGRSRRRHAPVGQTQVPPLALLRHRRAARAGIRRLARVPRPAEGTHHRHGRTRHAPYDHPTRLGHGENPAGNRGQDFPGGRGRDYRAARRRWTGRQKGRSAHPHQARQLQGAGRAAGSRHFLRPSHEPPEQGAAFQGAGRPQALHGPLRPQGHQRQRHDQLQNAGRDDAGDL